MTPGRLQTHSQHLRGQVPAGLGRQRVCRTPAAGTRARGARAPAGAGGRHARASEQAGTSRLRCCTAAREHGLHLQRGLEHHLIHARLDRVHVDVALKQRQGEVKEERQRRAAGAATAGRLRVSAAGPCDRPLAPDLGAGGVRLWGGWVQQGRCARVQQQQVSEGRLRAVGASAAARRCKPGVLISWYRHMRAGNSRSGCAWRPGPPCRGPAAAAGRHCAAAGE